MSDFKQAITECKQMITNVYNGFMSRFNKPGKIETPTELSSKMSQSSLDSNESYYEQFSSQINLEKVISNTTRSSDLRVLLACYRNSPDVQNQIINQSKFKIENMGDFYYILNDLNKDCFKNFTNLLENHFTDSLGNIHVGNISFSFFQIKDPQLKKDFGAFLTESLNIPKAVIDIQLQEEEGRSPRQNKGRSQGRSPQQ